MGFNWFKKIKTKKVFINPTGKKIRNDDFGLGHFGAPRKSHVSKRTTHEGVDYEAEVGQSVKAVMAGDISKVGYPYASDLSFRYVEINGDNGYLVRQFYVEPKEGMQIGMVVKKGDNIGTCQNLSKKFKGMKNHIHVEIKKDGKLVNPEELIGYKTSRFLKILKTHQQNRT